MLNLKPYCNTCIHRRFSRSDNPNWETELCACPAQWEGVTHSGPYAVATTKEILGTEACRHKSTDHDLGWYTGIYGTFLVSLSLLAIFFAAAWRVIMWLIGGPYAS